MRKLSSVLFITILSTFLFSFSNATKSIVSNEASNILGMVLLEDPNSFDMEGTINELKTKWKLDVNKSDADEQVAILTIDDYTIAVAVIPAAIPNGEVESMAEFNYFWKNGVKESAKHKGHVILSIMNAGKNPVQENLLYTKIASAVMNNSKSIGIYMGSRTLVLEKEMYQSNVEVMSKEDLPLYNWVYFGVRSEKGKQSVYTFGLAEFGKQEMEIVDSKKSLAELSKIIYDIAHYVIAQDITLSDGETIGMTADQKLKISESKGRFLEGRTLKIVY